ncbi:MAG: AMP-binding protein [Bacillota bacterium]|nr:AMP-binding protein [Bacillota bacterium]
MSALTDFVRSAYSRSSAVRETFKAAGLTPDDIREAGDLARLPVTHKAELIQRQQDDPPFGGFLTCPVTELARIFVSPGPIYDPQGLREDYWGWAEALAAAGFARGDIVQNTFSYHLTPAGMMFDGALRKLGCTVIPAGVGNSEHQLRVMRDVKVNGYVGVPSFLYALLQKAEEMGFTCPGDLRLKRAWVTAERLSEDLRSLLYDRYGIAVYQGYGTADTGCVAYECRKRRGLHPADRVLLEIADPATGQPLGPGQAGEVVVTILEPSYPLLRFGTGDLGVMTVEPCACGLPGPRLLGILGRTGDGVKVRGLFLYPHQIDELVQRIPGALRCQAVVTRKEFRDELTLLVELASPEDAGAGSDGVAALARDILRLRAAVEFVPPGSLKGEERLVDRRRWES